MTQSSPVTWEVEIRVNGESHLTIGSNHLAGDPNVNEEIVEKCARHLLSFIGRPTPETQERIAELQYEAGMYQSLYENAISAVAAGPSKEARDWAAGELPAIEAYKRANPDWLEQTKPAREVIGPAQGSGVRTVEAVADAIDNARYQHPDHPRERPRPFADADRSDREYALRLARAALALPSATRVGGISLAEPEPPTTTLTSTHSPGGDK